MATKKVLTERVCPVCVAVDRTVQEESVAGVKRYTPQMYSGGMGTPIYAALESDPKGAWVHHTDVAALEAKLAAAQAREQKVREACRKSQPVTASPLGYVPAIDLLAILNGEGERKNQL